MPSFSCNPQSSTAMEVSWSLDDVDPGFVFDSLSITQTGPNGVTITQSPPAAGTVQTGTTLFSELQPNTQYSYAISASWDDGSGGVGQTFTDQCSCTTKAAPPPPPPPPPPPAREVASMFHKGWNGQQWLPSVTGWDALGGAFDETGVLNPGAASSGADADLFGVGSSDLALYHKGWNGQQWTPSMTGWDRLGGLCGSTPCVAARGALLDVFTVGDNDGVLYHKQWDGQQWLPSETGYDNLGGACIGDPCVATWDSTRLDIFVVGSADSALYHKAWNGQAWVPSNTGWESLGGQFANQDGPQVVLRSSPCVASWGPNRLDVFGVGVDTAIYHKAWDGQQWQPSVTGWENLSGQCSSYPCVVSWGPNRLDVFVVGAQDNALYHKAWDGNQWSPSQTGWDRLGGACVPNWLPCAVSWAPNRLDIFVVGVQDGALYHKAWDGQQWSPSQTDWDRLGGACKSAPCAVQRGVGLLDIFVLA